MKTEDRVTITPELAACWLASSKGNRTLAPLQVAKIAADITNGRWQYNGDRIRFLPDGTLYDGHHRLNACIAAGLPIVADIFVIDEAARATVDKGRSRSVGDVLIMEHGVSNSESADIAAAMRFMVAHDFTSGIDWFAASRGGLRTPEFAKHLTDQGMSKFYDDNKDDLHYALDWVNANIKRPSMLIPRSQLVAFLCLGSKKIGWSFVERFIREVMTGYGVVEGSTQDMIRARLMMLKLGQAKSTPAARFYSVLIAFRSISAGRKITTISGTTYKPGTTAPRFY